MNSHLTMIDNPRKRSRSPDRPYSTPLPPIGSLPTFDSRHGAAPYPSHAGPTSAPRFDPPRSAPSPSHYASRTPPQLHTGYQPPQPARPHQSLPSLSEVMGGPSPLKPLVAPGGLVNQHPYSAPGSQTTSPHPSHSDQRPRGYEHQSFGNNDVYARPPPPPPSQYSNGYPGDPRAEHPGARYQPTASPLTPVSNHSPLPYGPAPQYPHDHYRGAEPHFMKKENGMSSAIPPYGPSAEKALVYSVLKQDAAFIHREILPALERYPKTVESLEHGGSVSQVIDECTSMKHFANKLLEMAERGIREAHEYEVRAAHVNSIPEPRVHHPSQPPRGSPYNQYSKVDDVYEEKRFTQPDQKRARRGVSEPIH
ncbi:hypothetical protein BJ508DRAFT_6134 [Ascobolus immersus RN42]|uniref:Uncharacterized protein n=1 Tax=Ascobolus immersus RN42 TaxID=1160509 RepID=A0A3N4IIK8_ASCIM|nr:hypothetical protein BJ508DRAFT_6134 [Ascobolus immersus RN42]